MAKRWRTTALVLIACLALCPGCGFGGKRRAVSGTVTFRGQPLDHGTITFLTTSGPPGPAGGALIRAGGSYELPAAQGLEPGTYRVSISAGGPGGTRTPEQIAAGASTPARELIPPEYNGETTTLTAEVKAGGDNRFNFDLK